MRPFGIRGKTVFLTTHLMEEAEQLCDRVAIIEHGRIADIGRPEELVSRHCPERAIVLVTNDATAEARFRAIAKVEHVSCQDARCKAEPMDCDRAPAVRFLAA